MSNKDIILAAMTNNSSEAFKYASNRLKHDKEIMLANRH
jgi:hypothetical protein